MIHIRADYRVEVDKRTIITAKDLDKETLQALYDGEPFTFSHRMENSGVHHGRRIGRSVMRPTAITLDLSKGQADARITCELDPDFFPETNRWIHANPDTYE